MTKFKPKELQLVVNGTYKTADGYQVTIVNALEQSVSEDSQDALQYDQGYRFRANDGGTYLPNGQYDATQKTCLDLVEAVSKTYVVTYELIAFIKDDYFTVTALNPIDAILQFKKDEDKPFKKVYELVDVTPDINLLRR